LPFEAFYRFIEEKLNSNAKDHIEKVQQRRKKSGKKTEIDEADMSVEKAQLVFDWVDGASRIDPHERDLASVWRALLDKILDDQHDAEELLHAVQTVSRSTLRFFVEAFAKTHARLSWSPIRRIGAQFTRQEDIKKLADAKLLRQSTASAIVTLSWNFCGDDLPYS
jgi:hypothetical protein